MKALIDGDILRYEIGFAAETGYRAITGDGEAFPPFSFVDEMLQSRLVQILHATKADDFKIFITEGKTFRDEIAVTKPYKGHRVEKKPWHFQNLTGVFTHAMNTQVITGIEADDALAIEHLSDEEETILVSRDKDLRQVPGHFYSWELGNQPAFGPAEISQQGHIYLTDKKQIRGTGLAFFYSQLLTGDQVDNIPGVPKVGPVGAYELLKDCETIEEYRDVVIDTYRERVPDNWEDYLLEQGRLCWMVRRLHPDGSPVLWEIDMIE